MGKTGILISPPMAFLIMVLTLSIFYLWVGKFASRGEKSRDKQSTYACGENLSGFKFQFGYRLFFIFALLFTIMHVAALVIATLPSVSPAAYFGIFYLAAIFLSVVGMVYYDNKDSDVSLDGEEKGD
ncbi:MAG: hypothetical protein NC830_01890 [Candidatus Omnitrophica bacterium]|nr:hypothetical protein [Candidatus Omnitrophota bacterium]